MRRTSCFVILTILLFLLAPGKQLGCLEGEWENNDPALENIADGQIMGMTRHYKPTPIKVIEVIEKDDYGRILFKTSNALTFDLGMSRVTAYIIAQKEDGETGYCLPDICYELVQYYDGEISEERLQDLKARNGWNTEPDGRGWASYGKPKSKFYKYNAVERTVFSVLKLDPDNDRCITVTYVESDANGLMLFGDLVEIKEQTDESGGLFGWLIPGGKTKAVKHLYLMVTDKYYNCIAYELVENIEDLSELTIKLKEEAGWEQVYEF